MGEITSLDQLPTGPAVAVWDLISQKLTECNDTFATLFNVVQTMCFAIYFDMSLMGIYAGSNSTVLSY